jgi:hypothetical protein
MSQIKGNSINYFSIYQFVKRRPVRLLALASKKKTISTPLVDDIQLWHFCELAGCDIITPGASG